MKIRELQKEYEQVHGRKSSIIDFAHLRTGVTVIVLQMDPLRLDNNKELREMRTVIDTPTGRTSLITSTKIARLKQ